MTDLPLPHPLDDQAADLLDAGLDAPAGDPALATRLAELRAVRAALADVDATGAPPDPARREASIAAALAAFDAQLTPAAPVVPIRVAAERGAARRAGRAWLPAVAAAAVLVVGVVGVRQMSRTSGDREAGSAAPPPELAAKSASAEAARPADAAGGATSATTAAAAATTRAAASATTAAGAAATTGAPFATTTPAAPSVAAPAATDGPLAARPYLGEIGSRAELDRAYDALRSATPPAVSAGESVGGREAVEAAADAGCPWSSFGQPLALLRWQGRPAVLVLGDLVRVVSFDACIVVYERPA